jgi:hypothetical protein
MVALRLLAAASALALSGCGASVLASNPRSVTVESVNVRSAQPLADAECKKHGRYARYRAQTSGMTYDYDCVE